MASQETKHHLQSSRAPNRDGSQQASGCTEAQSAWASDWLIGLLIYRHGLRVSEACDLRWDDLDLAARTVVIRRLKGSRDSTHYLERDELWGLRRLPRSGAYVFVNERGDPFKRERIARLIQRAGEAARLPFPVHDHMLRHACGYALANMRKSGLHLSDIVRTRVHSIVGPASRHGQQFARPC